MALSPSKNLTPRKQAVHKQPRLASSYGDDTISTPESESKPYRIWLSGFIVKRPKSLFLNRKWNFSDIRKFVFFVMIHGLAMFGLFTFSWGAFFVGFILHCLIGTAITLSYHRNLAHSSFKLPKWLEYSFAYLGSLALQGDPITWVSAHRFHHKYVDSEKDPHTPLEGFWFSHIGWIFDTGYIVEKRGEQNNVDDLKKQTFYKFMRRTYSLHTLALGLLLYAYGGFSYVVWGMGVRAVCGYHSTFLVNSACHIWGNRAWNTGDLSKNNWWVAVLAVGEGWHNNHHAFEYSARQGLEWWQLDVTWYVIRLLQALGLATDVKLPSEAHKSRMAL